MLRAAADRGFPVKNEYSPKWPSFYSWVNVCLMIMLIPQDDLLLYHNEERIFQLLLLKSDIMKMLYQIPSF